MMLCVIAPDRLRDHKQPGRNRDGQSFDPGKSSKGSTSGAGVSRARIRRRRSLRL